MPRKVLSFRAPHAASALNLRGLYVSSAFRILFGIALIYIAPATQWPEFLHILGLFTIAAGFVLLLLGLDRLHKIGVWWCGQSAGILRIWSFFAFLSIFLAGLRPRPLGRKERPQQAKRRCFIGRGLGRGCRPLPNLWLHPNGMFPYCLGVFLVYAAWGAFGF